MRESLSMHPVVPIDIRSEIHRLAEAVQRGSAVERARVCVDGARRLFGAKLALLHDHDGSQLRLLAGSGPSEGRGASRIAHRERLPTGLHRGLPAVLSPLGKNSLGMVTKTPRGMLYLTLHRGEGDSPFNENDEAALVRFGRDALPALIRRKVEVLEDLTTRQAEIIASFAAGKREREICAHLGISKHTFRTHVRSLYKRLSVQSRAELLALRAVSDVFINDPAPLPPLSPRQQQVLERLLTGMSEKEIAGSLNLSQHTVHTYTKQLHKALSVNNRTQLIARFAGHVTKNR